ncbi:MAG: diaminopimelate epimerase [Flavobacteriales bacterium]|nr:diaminopimelate epimerase [Flavobacteriales bacterium]
MAIIPFSKWQGTGNDFILVDDRDGALPTDAVELARKLCDRHFGIGSDGLILLRRPEVEGTLYHMEFLNPDGSRSFCGNGSRCAFAFRSMLLGDRAAAKFTAIDGVHKAKWSEDEVEITMRDVEGIERLAGNMDLLHTGSPHLVIWVEDPAAVDIVPTAHEHRYGARFAKEGVNVNFVRWHDGRVEMRTYERGVEAETLSCGTGVTAAALSAMARGHGHDGCAVTTPGGALHVSARRSGEGFADILLRGPVKEVFKGEVELSA